MVQKGDARLVKEAEEQKILRRMLRLRERGQGPQGIANTLNAEKRYNRNGRSWSRQGVWQVLESHDGREEARASA